MSQITMEVHMSQIDMSSTYESNYYEYYIWVKYMSSTSESNFNE